MDEVLRFYVDSDAAGRLTFVMFLVGGLLSLLLVYLVRYISGTGRVSLKATETIQSLVETSAQNTSKFADALKAHEVGFDNIAKAMVALNENTRALKDDLTLAIETKLRTAVSEVLHGVNAAKDDTLAEIKKTREAVKELHAAIMSIKAENETSRELIQRFAKVASDLETVMRVSENIAARPTNPIMEDDDGSPAVTFDDVLTQIKGRE